MAKEQRTAWEQAARVSILGEKRELESLPGYWIRPKKYGVRGENDINAASLRETKSIPIKIQRKLLEAFKDKEQLTDEELASILDDDELDAILDKQRQNTSKTYDVMRLVLLYGIGAHNFDDQDSSSEVVSEALVEQILEYEPIAEEVFGIVAAHNRPLASGMSSTSETQPNTSTTAQNSKQEPEKPN